MQIDKLIRSRRKSLSIEIGPNAEVIVRAPLRATERWIRASVAKNEDWITKHQSEERRKLAEAPNKDFVPGEKYLFLGHWYELCLSDIRSKKLGFDTCFILPTKCEGCARQVFEKWYRTQARQIISQRVAWYADALNLKYRRISITGAMKQWGSCSGRDSLNFSWRIILAPIEVIDYVIVHELCHVVEKNHSPRFWSQVIKIIPEYKLRKKWLKENDHYLKI